MESQHNSIFNWVISTISTGAILGTAMGLVPIIGGLVAIVWYCIQIKESQTYRNWHARRRSIRIARLKARLRLLETQPAPLPPEIEDKL